MSLTPHLYKDPKINWSLTNEQGISTADLNRIEGNSKHVDNIEKNNVIVIGGNWRPTPLLDQFAQPFYVLLPVGFKLVIDFLNYRYNPIGNHQFVFGDGSEDLIPSPANQYFNSDTNNGGASGGNLALNQIIAENKSDDNLALRLGVYIGGSANTNVGWYIRLLKVPL